MWLFTLLPRFLFPSRQDPQSASSLTPYRTSEHRNTKIYKGLIRTFCFARPFLILSCGENTLLGANSDEAISKLCLLLPDVQRRGTSLHMKISVLTVVFNRVDTIATAIQSVTNQKYLNVEHIVVDGASNDGTLSVINANKSPDMLVFSEPDDGIYDALNKAITLSSGDVIGIVHSDDFFAHNQVLSKIAECFTDPEIDAVYGDLDYISASDTNRVVRHWKAGPFAPAKLKRGWMPPHPTLFIRRQVVECWGGYDVRYRIAADYDAMLRYLVKGKIKLAYIPEVLVKMRVGGESNRSLERILLKTREDLQAIRQNGVGGVGTLALKNLSKLPQFLKR